ncbi:MAG: hypothetical protein JWM95_679 [Gemmatimonadetes bacterium]|nr:hypothetical protein [Gemmatimonadota bacterium]
MTITAGMSPRDRRTLAFGIAIIGGIIGLSRGVPTWREWDESARMDAANAAGELANAREELVRLPVIRDSARARRARLDISQRRLLVAETVGIAGAMLATKVTDIADELGLKVSAIQIRADSVFRSAHAHVAVRLTASGDVQHLTDLLSALESPTELLAVRELSVSPTDPVLADGRPETLRFQVLVEGLAMHGARSTTP